VLVRVVASVLVPVANSGLLGTTYQCIEQRQLDGSRVLARWCGTLRNVLRVLDDDRFVFRPASRMAAQHRMMRTRL